MLLSIISGLRNVHAEEPVERVDLTDFDKNFELAVDKASKNNSSDVIRNSSPRHASYLMAKLIEKASETNVKVRVVSGRLFSDVFDEHHLMTQATSFVKSGGSISVRVEQEPDPRSQFVDLLRSHENCSIEVMPNAEQAPATPHFMLVGDNAFRLETNHESSSAFGCFNNKNVGKTLLSIFEHGFTPNDKRAA